MKKSVYLFLIAAVLVLTSCSKSELRHDKEISQAEQLMGSNPDSALTILETIDPSDFRSDSVKAKFHYLKAYGHIKTNRSMISDSLIYFVHNYYRGKDIEKEMRSGMAYAWYKFWVGDMPGAFVLLDSLVALPDVPDSLMAETLRSRVRLGASEYKGRQIIPLAKRLHILETDTLRKM